MKLHALAFQIQVIILHRFPLPFSYSTCYLTVSQCQRPLEPYLVEKLKSGNAGNDVTMEYAKLQSFFQAVQTIGSLIVGTILDKFGPKGGFSITFIASGISYLLLSQSTNIEILYLSKVPTIFQAGFLCAQLGLCLFSFKLVHLLLTIFRCVISSCISNH